MLISGGENLAWVSKQLGHNDIQMTTQVYAQLIPKSIQGSGYQPINDWGIAKNAPQFPLENTKHQ